MRHSKGRPQRALLVLGMHRSGTSVAARTVNLLGAELGGDLVPAGPDNQGGFWEHAEAVGINDELLHGLGRTWYDMRQMPEGWRDTPHAAAAARRIGRLIERDFAASALCAVKDPRLCLTAPVWIEAFESRGFKVACLFVVRDPVEVVESLHRRNDWPSAPLYLMWVQYLLEATAASEGRRRAILTYDQLLADWRGNMARVARALRLRWPAAADGSVASAVDAHIDPGRRHHLRLDPEDAHAVAGMPELAATLHRACLGIASGSQDWRAISGLQDAFRGASRLFATHLDRLLAERWEAEGRAQTAAARLGQQADVTTVVRDTVQDLRAGLDARVDAVEQRLETAAQQARALQADTSAVLEQGTAATASILHAVLQLREEISALSGETAARFERQREGMMTVEARIQRQHALLNTVSLRLEQAGNPRVAGVAAFRDAPRGTEARALQAALAGSNAAIAALMASTSWKLTAPLRWLSVHVLRRPPPLVAPATPGAPGAGVVGDGSLPASTVRAPVPGSDGAAGSAGAAVRTRPERRNGSVGPAGLRWRQEA